MSALNSASRPCAGLPVPAGRSGRPGEVPAAWRSGRAAGAAGAGGSRAPAGGATSAQAQNREQAGRMAAIVTVGRGG